MKRDNRRLSRTLKRRLPAVFVGILVLLTSVPLSSIATVSAAPIIFVGNGANSTNWSGYAVTGSAKSITSAQGSWIVPAVTCGGSETSYSSFWVGIDGFNSNTVEQTGTDSDCSQGHATYYAWIEFFPKPSKVISAFPITPGDFISASVKFNPPASRFGIGTFTLTIQDLTTGKTSSSSSGVLGAQRSSAEFIVEAPAICGLLKCRLASLSNFGLAKFGADFTQVSGVNCAVGVNGNVQALGAYGSAIQQINMVSQANPSVVKAQPSALTTDGTSFTVQWMSAGP